MTHKKSRTMTLVLLLTGAAIGLIANAALDLSDAHASPSKRSAATKPKLPEAVSKAITSQFPKATIEEVEAERLAVIVYEVEMSVDGKERDVLVTSDGVILESMREINANGAPAKVRATLKKLSQSANLSELEQAEVHAEFQAVPLKQVRNEYKAEFKSRGREIEYRIAADGQVIGRMLSRDDDEEEDDDDDDDDGDDDGDDGDDDDEDDDD